MRTAGGLRPAVVVRAADRPQRALIKVLFNRRRRALVSGDASEDASSLRSGSAPTQVLGLIDFYHAAKQLSDAVKTAPLERDLNAPAGSTARGGCSSEARVDEVITALRELCRGRTAGKIRTRTSTTSMKNRHRIRLHGQMVGHRA